MRRDSASVVVTSSVGGSAGSSTDSRETSVATIVRREAARLSEGSSPCLNKPTNGSAQTATRLRIELATEKRRDWDTADIAGSTVNKGCGECWGWRPCRSHHKFPGRGNQLDTVGTPAVPKLRWWIAQLFTRSAFPVENHMDTIVAAGHWRGAEHHEALSVVDRLPIDRPTVGTGAAQREQWLGFAGFEAAAGILYRDRHHPIVRRIEEQLVTIPTPCRIGASGGGDPNFRLRSSGTARHRLHVDFLYAGLGRGE